MAEEATQDQVLQAASSFGSAEFTREDVAGKLGLEISEMKTGWKAAKEAGQVEKVRDEDDKRYFKVVAS